MVLKPQDLLVILKLVAMGRKPWTYAGLGVELGMSPSAVHAAVRRTLKAQLAVRGGDEIVPHLRNLEEFIIHGLKYAFVPERGELTRGIPTAHATAPLDRHFAATGDPPPVWPFPSGDVRGVAFSPLCPAAPKAAQRDPMLYKMLALIDAVRGGRARERDIAIAELSKRLSADASGA